MSLKVYSLLGLAVTFALLTSCQKNASFNPALRGSFFPLRAGMTWTYRVVSESGAGATLSDRVETGDRNKATAVVVSEYFGGDGTQRAAHGYLAEAEGAKSETRYEVKAGYITRSVSVSVRDGSVLARSEEQQFLPQYLSPDWAWSSSFSPFSFLKIAQHHQSFLESHIVIVPAGRFSGCIRIETEASYESPHGIIGKRYFLDWYAPNVGLVKSAFFERARIDRYLGNSELATALLRKTGFFRREIARAELLSFVPSSGSARPPMPAKAMK